MQTNSLPAASAFRPSAPLAVRPDEMSLGELNRLFVRRQLSTNHRGTIQPPPVPSQLRLRLVNLDLAPWTQFLPVPARVTGVAEADLRVNEPLAAGIPARVHGTIAVNGLGVADHGHEVLRARRIQASGLELQWPTRVVIGRVLVTGPRGTIERDHAGGLSTRDILGRPADVSPAPAEPVGAAPALAVDVREIVVRDGAIAWRDHSVSPPARLDVSRIEGSMTNAGWPLREQEPAVLAQHDRCGDLDAPHGRHLRLPPSALRRCRPAQSRANCHATRPLREPR